MLTALHDCGPRVLWSCYLGFLLLSEQLMQVCVRLESPHLHLLLYAHVRSSKRDKNRLLYLLHIRDGMITLQEREARWAGEGLGCHSSHSTNGLYRKPLDSQGNRYTVDEVQRTLTVQCTARICANALLYSVLVWNTRVHLVLS